MFNVNSSFLEMKYNMFSMMGHSCKGKSAVNLYLSFAPVCTMVDF
ncbi:hypothetical protein B4096_0783 [Heyndrickxia coagulans]|uniref:Uncharacterized protein n=1 Tax=Heyndrickxia coagulans TaxID=1398 RepID=A0AAN0T9X1_HEYCO|nr:hypothetical protein SB48_HM08orf05561 [Heyndrickxia coagulans]KYC60401.1 hypothetical protein B4100_0814 [Heyndrickxia coagulans]KYC85488.1 hypothetical protein B4096_0783 [Heyndrickxia coagulans]